MQKKMEAQSEETSSSSWSSATNWQISHGSLHTSITVDSSDSPVNSATSDLTAKSPLLLIPSLSDSAPCDIKISFKQKHEIRQVYIRSTARVYEIYYAPDLRSNNEYLCTVRCGIAERDEELLCTSDIQETVCKESKEKSEVVELSEEKYTNGRNNGSSEDDWVEVKNPNFPVLDKSNIQDFYEATAEITDSDPCISITLRLLSLQNKQRIIIDEIYVFADPVDCLSDSENQTALQAANSSGNSLMAMLAPTLLQLSKSGVNRLQESQPSTNKQQEYQEIKRPELNNTPTRIQNDEKPDDSGRGERKYGFVAKNGDDVYSRFEGILDRLETRVGRIEDMFLRFEENMVKPINGIENRIQRVEEQLEVLSGSFRNLPVFPSYTRFSAPAFSSMEDSFSSSYNEGADLQEPEKDSPEPEKNSPAKDSLEPEKDSPAKDSLEPEKDSPAKDAPANGSTVGKVLPLPQESEPEKDSPVAKDLPREPEPEKDSPANDSVVGKPKKSVSIDDALAAAFAGFFSMAAVNPPKPNDILERIDTDSVSNTEPLKYTQTLKVTAPEFIMEENDSEDETNNFPDSCVESPLFEEVNQGCTSCSSVGTAIAKDRLSDNDDDDDKQIIEELVPKRDAFVVDFETPILDVAFVSRENSSSNFPLEALLGVEVEESDSLVVVEDGGTDDNRLLLDFEGYDGVAQVGEDKVTCSDTEEVCESLI